VSTEAAELFFSLLALAAAAAVILLNLARLLAGRLAAAREVIDATAPVALGVAWLVAATCMAGSLYFSEVAHFTPCALCWYQRIAMYPLAIVLLVAALVRDGRIWRYVVPVAAIGAAFSLYHYAVEWFPEADSGVCSSQFPCTFVWFRRFGFVSLPFMALCGFLLIISLVTLRRTDGQHAEADEAHPATAAA
jgi:disulfide bond formation protein DsbB